MSEVTKAELATRGLDVARAEGLVLVYDGQTKWLCRAADYDEAVASLATKTVDLSDMDAVERQELESDAYAELCDRIEGPVAATGGNGQGWHAELVALVRRAVAAGLLTGDDPLVKRYTA